MVAEDNIRHIQSLVDQASVAIHNLWLFESEAKARKEAEQANALRLQFLAMISHELRTPLTSIKGFITTLLAEDVTWDPASQRDFLETANQETDRLRNLIEQLLDLSQLEARIMRIHPREHPLLEMVSNILNRLKAATINHQLVLNISGNLPPVMADRRRIEQVLINLIDNAAKYSPPGTTIVLSAHRAGDFVQVDVSDHGPGISAEERAYVFDAFRRGREENTRRVRGAGLGLSICRGIIEAHHGRIWIDEDDGSGTTISFTLPAAE
jgi:two-component system sensor histidine kinase KdpD